jgi:hypothetical protein
VRVPIAAEQSWDGVPENLSDILKKAKEAEEVGVQQILQSREDLMDVKHFINESCPATPQETLGMEYS